jgi:hypothetical protein
MNCFSLGDNVSLEVRIAQKFDFEFRAGLTRAKIKLIIHHLV